VQQRAASHFFPWPRTRGGSSAGRWSASMALRRPGRR